MGNGGLAMWPDHFYMTGLGQIAYAMLYLPASLGASILLYLLLLKRISNLWLRWGITLPLAFLIATAPLLQVYSISMEAKQLCRAQGGLHVYKAVKAEGFLGGSNIETWSKYGYKYVESGGTLNRKFRETILDAKPTTTEVPEYISRYQYKTGDNHRVVGKYFSRSSELVIDRQTNEVLGDLVVFGIYPGWLDNLAIGLTGAGSGFTPWSCGDEPPAGSEVLRIGIRELVSVTLKPVNSTKGETK